MCFPRRAMTCSDYVRGYLDFELTTLNLDLTYLTIEKNVIGDLAFALNCLEHYGHK
jgi:hypothetical protein